MWIRELQEFIDETLAPIIPNEIERNRYLTADMMKIWSRAFTSELYDHNESYESLEFLGDAVLKLIFPLYLSSQYPHLDKEMQDNLTVYYTKNTTLSEYSRALGFPQYVRIVGVETLGYGIEADVLEAFFGALFRVGDLVMRKQTGNPASEGRGFGDAKKFLEHLTRTVITIDMYRAEGPPKTIVHQIFARLSADSKLKEHFTEGKMDKIVLWLTDSQLTVLKEYGIEPRQPVGKGTGTNREAASEAAYTDALRYLATLGVTREWSENEKRSRELQHPTVSPYVPPAEKKLKKEGYKSMYFDVPRTTLTRGGKFLQLIGINATGKVILQSIFWPSGEDIHEGFAELLRLYA